MGLGQTKTGIILSLAKTANVYVYTNERVFMTEIICGNKITMIKPFSWYFPPNAFSITELSLKAATSN